MLRSGGKHADWRGRERGDDARRWLRLRDASWRIVETERAKAALAARVNACAQIEDERMRVAACNLRNLGGFECLDELWLAHVEWRRFA